MCSPETVDDGLLHPVGKMLRASVSIGHEARANFAKKILLEFETLDNYF
jgi:hypothetical protein